MKRKIVGIILMLILISSSFALFANAGSEKNPELEDETGECLSAIDIKSVWFFEKPDEPEYLYVNMKLTNYKIFRISQAFYVNFEINNKSYQLTFAKNFLLIPFCELMVYNNSHSEYYNIYGRAKKIGNIISWKIPKDLIGNPVVGDHITSIYASSYDLLYFGSRVIIPSMIMDKLNISLYDLYKSGIPILRKIYDYFQFVLNFSEDYTQEGKDYIFQY